MMDDFEKENRRVERCLLITKIFPVFAIVLFVIGILIAIYG